MKETVLHDKERQRLVCDANIKLNLSEIVLCKHELDGTVQDKLQW
jgi:hypothetical protein